MTCKYCKNSAWFWNKLGRCQRCINQLTLLSLISWIIWWVALRDNPKSIESIALIMASLAFNGLLMLHLWMRFIILPWRNRQAKSPQTEKVNDKHKRR